MRIMLDNGRSDAGPLKTLTCNFDVLFSVIDSEVRDRSGFSVIATSHST